jgi:PTH1 family peptidyl-tRNA hydrolase
MIKLIIGLGNPSQCYQNTRHNAGFLFLEQLALDNDGTWTQALKFQSELATCYINTQKIILLKPNTFMNRSGEAVGLLIRYYKLTVDDILVVHDELDFIPGVIKLKQGGGHAGHNGLRNIIAHLNSNDFYRLRIGIGRPPIGKNVADYVLSEPSKTEYKLITAQFPAAERILIPLISTR